jgi:hypothetical protein
MPDALPQLSTPNTPAESQGVLFDLAEVEGFGALGHRERLFCEFIVQGCSQRAAARAAGVKGDDAAVDVIASRLAHKREVRRFLGQCWQKSGSSIEATLQQAARVQARAINDYENATNKDARAAAMKEWRDASALIASIHGRLGIRIEGQVNHAHAHVHGQAQEVVPAGALGFLAQIRRSVVNDRIAAAGKLPAIGSQAEAQPNKDN